MTVDEIGGGVEDAGGGVVIDPSPLLLISVEDTTGGSLDGVTTGGVDETTGSGIVVLDATGGGVDDSVPLPIGGGSTMLEMTEMTELRIELIGFGSGDVVLIGSGVVETGSGVVVLA
jgi:hypothetical protein